MDDLVEPGPVWTMSEVESALAREMYQAIQDFSRYDERGQQTAEYKVGISDLGFCSERTNRMLQQMDPEDSDLLAAFTGTALGDYMERAWLKMHPTAIVQSEVMVPLVGELHTYNLFGHPDIVQPEGILIDGKTTRGLEVVRRTGPSQQQQFQRHTYAYGAWLGKMFNQDVALEDVQVANIWMDRACDDKELHVDMEPFSMDMVEQATQWLDEVVYAFTHKQEARKEPPREMCAKICGFYRDCRMLDTDVEGLLTDDTVLASIEMYQEGKELESMGKRLKDQSKGNLDHINGSTGEFTVRWVHVGGSHVEYDRKAYDKLDIRRIK